MFQYVILLILPLVCGCENLRVTLREEHRLTVFRDRLLRKIFGLKMDKVTAG
jgi:hypothetical protein